MFYLLGAGKGKRPNRADPVTEQEEELLWNLFTTFSVKGSYHNFQRLWLIVFTILFDKLAKNRCKMPSSSVLGIDLISVGLGLGEKISLPIN